MKEKWTCDLLLFVRSFNKIEIRNQFIVILRRLGWALHKLEERIKNIIKKKHR